MLKPCRIAFEPALPFSRRPFRARVVTLPGGLRLGTVRWAVRKAAYVFEPTQNTSRDARLMSAIAEQILELPANGART